MITNHFIIGTAGHIDHGKTELVKVLTGVDTDRLADEKRRGISIDIGFASFMLPGGLEAGIVDVPGHERFIKNMLAGATGVDLLLLVVAADDGVMAQTIEHLAIAELLGISAAVVAVTKADIVEPDRLETVKSEIEGLTKDGVFKEAPIVYVSSKERLGLDSLVSEIEKQASHLNSRLLDLPPRLPIDRSFLLQGSGRIITGTLWTGVLSATTPLELLPSGQVCRVRRIEVHGSQAAKALAGQRVAINLVVSGKTPRRGDFLVAQGSFNLVKNFVAKIKVLPQAPKPIKSRTWVRLYHGAKEVRAKINLIGVPKIGPGQSGYASLLLDEQIVASFQDRFILRSISPITTIAGGTFLEVLVKRQSKDLDIVHLEALATGDDQQVIKEFLKDSPRPLTADEIAVATQLGGRSAEVAITGLVEAGKATELSVWQQTYYMDAKTIGEIADDLKKFLFDFHKKQLYQVGAQKEIICQTLLPELSTSQADIILDYFVASGLIVKVESRLTLAELIKGDPALAKLKQISSAVNSFAPLDFKRLANQLELSDPDLRALLKQLESEDLVVAVSPDLYFSSKAVSEAADRLTDYLVNAGEISISQFKELLGTTRKYAVPLMEYFDRKKLTRRTGDTRILY